MTRPISDSIFWRAGLVAASLAVVACGAEQAKPDAAAPSVASVQADGASAPAPAAQDAHQAAEGPVKVVDGPPPGGDGERYALAIDPPADAKAGEAAKVTIRVIPQAPWHINLDFPTSLQINAPQGVSVENADLKKADATELNADTAAFAVAFTSESPGEKAFTGKFKFAVCQDEACSPVTEDVEFQVAIK